VSLTLYGAAISPFVRKVRLALREKGLEYQMELINPFSPPDWYAEFNPLRRVPTLQDGEMKLADSSVICQYLEDKHPEVALYGQTPEQRAQVRWLEKYCDYELAPLSTFGVFFQRVIKRLMGQDSDEAHVAQALAKLPPHFDYLEQVLGQRAFFVGERWSMADAAFTCQIITPGYGNERLDLQRWPGLAAHYQRSCQRPALAELLTAEGQFLARISQRRP
jgi:glutathione S-transferase